MTQFKDLLIKKGVTASDLIRALEGYNLGYMKDVVDVFNRKLEEWRWYEDIIHSMDELDEEMYNLTATEIIESIDTYFSTSDTWFYYENGIYYSLDNYEDRLIKLFSYNDILEIVLNEMSISDLLNELYDLGYEIEEEEEDEEDE